MLGAGDDHCKVDSSRAEKVGREAWYDVIVDHGTLLNVGSVNTGDRAIEIAGTVLCENTFILDPAEEVAKRLVLELEAKDPISEGWKKFFTVQNGPDFMATPDAADGKRGDFETRWNNELPYAGGGYSEVYTGDRVTAADIEEMNKILTKKKK